MAHVLLVGTNVLTLLPMQVEDLELSPIVSADDVPIVVHGTNRRAWQQIKMEVHVETIAGHTRNPHLKVPFVCTIIRTCI